MDAKDYIQRCKDPSKARERPLSREVANGVFIGGVRLFFFFLVLFLAYQAFDLWLKSRLI